MARSAGEKRMSRPDWKDEREASSVCGSATRRSLVDESGRAVDGKKPGAKSSGANQFVIISGIAGPTSYEAQRSCASIGDAMRGPRWNVMQAARRHFFDTGLAVFIHQDQGAQAVDGGIKFGAIGFGVGVPVSHEIFAANLSGFDHGVAPEQATFGTIRNWRPPLNGVNKGVGRKGFAGHGVEEKVLEVADGFAAALDPGAMKNTRGPVHLVHADPLARQNGANRRRF